MRYNGFGAGAVWLSELPVSTPTKGILKILNFISKAKNKLKVCEAGIKWLCDNHVPQIAPLPRVMGCSGTQFFCRCIH